MSTATSCEMSITAGGKKGTLKKLLAPPEVPFRSSVSFDTFQFELVDYKHRDDPDWSEWRSNLKGVVGGSDIAALLGHNTPVSPRACLKQIHGITAKKEPNHFAKTCMDHGKKYESTVLEVLGMYQKMCPGITVVYEISRISDPTGPKIRVCVSPDHYVANGGCLYEVKCPYVGSTGEFGDSYAFYANNRARYPNGKEAYFLQALFYRVMLNLTLNTLRFGDNFGVAIGFVNNDEEITVRLLDYRHHTGALVIITRLLEKLLRHTTPGEIERWRVTKEERDDVTECMRTSLAECYYLAGRDLGMDGSLLFERWRVTKDERGDVTECMRTSLAECYYLAGRDLGMDGSLLLLEEHSESDSRDNSPSPPRE